MSNLVLAYIAFLGVMAVPGPDTLIVLRNALGYSARTGIITTFGILSAATIRFGYCIGGVAILVAESVFFYNLLKWAGAGYLVYIGISSLLSEGESLKKDEITDDLAYRHKPDKVAFTDGFMTNLLNPKATIFFLALFSQVITPGTDWRWLVVYAVVCTITALIWFVSLALIMGLKPVRRFYAKASRWIDRVFGVFFILLAGRLFFSK